VLAERGRLPVEAGAAVLEPEPAPTRRNGARSACRWSEHVAVLRVRWWTISSIFQMEPQGRRRGQSRLPVRGSSVASADSMISRRAGSLPSARASLEPLVIEGVGAPERAHQTGELASPEHGEHDVAVARPDLLAVAGIERAHAQLGSLMQAHASRFRARDGYIVLAVLTEKQFAV